MPVLSVPTIAMGISILALLYAVVLIVNVIKKPRGSEKMIEISKSIQEGAMAYLNRQSITILPFAIVIFLVLAFVLPKMGGRVPSCAARQPALETSIIHDPSEARQAKAVTAETMSGTRWARGSPAQIWPMASEKGAPDSAICFAGNMPDMAVQESM